MIKKAITYLILVSALSGCFEQSIQAKHTVAKGLALVSGLWFLKIPLDQARIRKAQGRVIKAIEELNEAKQAEGGAPLGVLQALDDAKKRAIHERDALNAKIGVYHRGLGQPFGWVGGRILVGMCLSACSLLAFAASSIS